MIANITTGSFTKGLIKYHEDKITEGKAKIFHSNLFMPESLGVKNIQRIFNNFTGQSKRKDKNFHVSLNFKKEDYNKLKPEQVKSIIEDYLKEIGFPHDHPFMSYEHFDKQHPHIHIITPKILETGKVLNDSNIFIRSRKISRKIEQKYNISNAEKQKESRGVVINTADYNILKQSYDNKKISLKKFLSLSVKKYLSENKPTSMNELKQGLSDINIYMYQTKHKKTGLIFTTKQNTEKLQAKDTGIKSSNLDNSLTFKKLESTFKENKKERKRESIKIANKINLIFFKYYKLNISTFKEQLKKYNIQLNINKTNETIRGFSYEYNGIKYKGQDLPQRRYTMSKIEHKFGSDTIYSQSYIVKALLYKNKLNKLKNIPINTFISKSLKIGLYPKLTEKGIEISLQNNIDSKENNNPYLIDYYNSEIGILNPEQLKLANKRIHQEVLKINVSDKVNLKGEQTQESSQLPKLSVLSFFDEMISDISSENNEFFNDELPNISKKKKRKKRL